MFDLLLSTIDLLAEVSSALSRASAWRCEEAASQLRLDAFARRVLRQQCDAAAVASAWDCPRSSG
jgi:hypothetical protein